MSLGPSEDAEAIARALEHLATATEKVASEIGGLCFMALIALLVWKCS